MNKMILVAVDMENGKCKKIMKVKNVSVEEHNALLNQQKEHEVKEGDKMNELIKRISLLEVEVAYSKGLINKDEYEKEIAKYE